MTINNISSSHFSISGTALGTEGQLALLMLENEEAQKDTANADKALARDRFVEASNAEVAAMREEADDIRLGAFFQAGASLTAAGIQAGDVLMAPECDAQGKEKPEAPWGEIGAGAANSLSQPLGKWIGDAAVADDRGDAKRAGSAAEQAAWDQADANDAIDHLNDQRDRVTSWLQSENSEQANATAGILANLA
jgi:hypothetical protein